VLTISGYPVINVNIFCHLISCEIAIWACESQKVNCKILGFYLDFLREKIMKYFLFLL